MMQPGPKPSARSPEESSDTTSAGAESPSGSTAGSAAEEAPRRPALHTSGSVLRPGERIGAYRVERRLGRGGMGDVYLAFDDRLGRLVAIKRIRHEGPLSEIQRERFRREARAAAQLNHPAIVQIFDLVTAGDSGDSGRAGGSDALVMEYVDGESLADIVARGPLDAGVAVRFAREIALGLAAAHAAGFVHRDLKTENVMVTASGAVKILDFGLVKSVWREGSQDDEQSLTAEGIVLGTFHTISPEQVRGGEADARSDLFSLGVLLYELLTGQSPFRGGSHVDSLRRIVTHHPPPLATVCPGLPRELGALLERLLEKDPRRRPQSARDVVAALGEIAALPGMGGPGAGGGFKNAAEETLSDRPTFPGAALPAGYDAAEIQPVEAEAGWPGEDDRRRASHGAAARVSQAGGRASEPSAGPARPFSSQLPRRLAVAVLPVAAAIAAYLLLRSGPLKPAPPGAIGQPVHATFTQLTDFAGSESFPSISPDGSFFLYSKAAGGRSHIYLQRAGGGIPIDLSRDSPAADTHPAFSPDGQQIAFRSERDGGGIFVMGATGESVRRLTDFGYNPAWSPDGTEVLCATDPVDDPATRTSDSRIWAVVVATGARRVLVTGDAVQPAWSPHGWRIAYWGVARGSARRVISTIRAGITAPPTSLIDDPYLNWSPAWAPDGKYLYFASDRSGAMSLWRIAIDEATGKGRGEPEPLSTPAQWSGLLSISRDGRRIVYATRDGKSNLEKVAFDPAAGRTVGPLQAVTAGSRFVRSCDVSPDGRWIAFDSVRPQEDLFIVRPDGSDPRQLTNDRYKDRQPVWSPDGSRLAFYSNRGGRYDLWSIRPDGSGLEQITRRDGPGPTYFPIWSPDGHQLACLLKLHGDELGAALIDLDRPPRQRIPAELPVAGGEKETFSATSWSPDGRWLAGNVGTDLGIYSLSSRRTSRLARRGDLPQWLRDGSRLVYLAEGKLFLIDIRSHETRMTLEPPASSTFTWVCLGPGDRFLYLVRANEEGHIWMLTLA